MSETPTPDLTERAREVMRSLPPNTWDVSVWTASQVPVAGVIDLADVWRILAAVLATLSAERSAARDELVRREAREQVAREIEASALREVGFVGPVGIRQNAAQVAARIALDGGAR